MALCAGLQHSPTIQDTLFKLICFQLSLVATESLPMLIAHTEQTSAGESGRFFVMEDLLRKEGLGRLAPEVNLMLCAVFLPHHFNFIVSSDGFTYCRIMSLCPISIPLLSFVNLIMEGVPP